MRCLLISLLFLFVHLRSNLSFHSREQNKYLAEVPGVARGIIENNF